jgi:translation initiation factor 2B subunit (eIF-2B alpha/beta/delta family)
MNTNDRENLYKLFRDMTDVLGTSRMTEIALESFIRATQSLKCPREAILPLFNELSECIKQSKPRVVPLIHLLEEFEDEMRFTRADLDLEAIRAEAVETLQEKLDVFRERVQRLTERGAEYVKDGDVLLVHSASGVVIKILTNAKEKLQRTFKVIVLKQDFSKTRQLIQALAQAGIPHEVVPEYDLIHHLPEATKLFIGAVAVTPDRNVVASAGTANIVSLCHVGKIPVYLFVNSLKFSHQSTQNQHIHRKEEAETRGGLTYSLTTYSHSLVALKLIDHVITGSGELKTAAEA